MKKEFEDILTKVSQLYLKYGIKSVTMDDVSRELGISKKTLYKHVSDKVDLVEKVLYNDMSQVEKRFKAICQSKKNAILELVAMNRQMHEMIKNYNPLTFYDLKKYYPVLFDQFISERSEKMYKWILENIKKGKKEGLYRSELNSEVIAKLYVSRVENMCRDEARDHNKLISRTFHSELFIYHIRGISNHKGIKEFEKYNNPLKLKEV